MFKNQSSQDKALCLQIKDGSKVQSIHCKVIDVIGDGNCFFRSLCMHPFFETFDHETLRNDLVRRIRKVTKDKHDWTGKVVRELYLKQKVDITARMNTVSRSTEWVRTEEVLCAMLLYGVTIDSYSAQMLSTGPAFIRMISRDTLRTYGAGKDMSRINGPIIRVFFHQAGNRYGLARVNNHFSYLQEVHKIPSGMDIVHTPIINAQAKAQVKITDVEVVEAQPARKQPAVSKVCLESSDRKQSDSASSTSSMLASKSKAIPLKGPKSYKGKTRGRKAGSKNSGVVITMAEWYDACHAFVNDPGKPSQASFLASNKCSENLTASLSHRQTFSRNLKKYRDGKLKASTNQRQRVMKYSKVEERLIQYLALRSERYKRDKCGLSWFYLKEKCVEWEKLENPNSKWKCSDGWLEKAMRRNDYVKVKLHGEAASMTDEEVEAVMNPFRKELSDLIDKHECSPDTVYNADQSGLFYQKLPNSTYVKKSKTKDIKGTKGMKDKTRLTMMICTAASGSRLPIAIVGKPKKPKCFELKRGKLPLPYTDQKNAWFTKETTMWWIHNVFWPWHLKENGNVPAILILDNCSAHKIKGSNRLPKKLFIIFLPPNVTNRHQPADMGMIAVLKIGYRMNFLHQLLYIFDAPGGYEAAAKLRSQQKPGCRGLVYGGKPHVLDAMEIVDKVWKAEDGKYITTEGIRRNWRKANILPPTWQADTNNTVGSISKKKTKTKGYEDLCNLMKSIQLKATETELDTKMTAAVMDKSFVNDSNVPREEWLEMAEVWAEVEDDPDVIEAVIDDEIEAIDKGCDGEIEVEEDHDRSMDMEIDEEPKVVSHIDVTEAIATIRNYMTKEGLSAEMYALDGLQRSIQQHRAAKATSSPSIKTFLKPTK